MKPARPTQADIARIAGVSVSTVSRALAGDAGISAPVEALVREAAERLGYTQRRGEAEAAPRTARPPGTLRLGAVLHAERMTSDLSPFYHDILAALRAAADGRGIALKVRLVGGDTLPPGQPLFDEDVDGVFLVGVDLDDVAASRALSGPPIVLVNGADPLMRFDCVTPANFYGGALATRALLDAGHRSLAYVGTAHRHTIQERVRGFRSAVEAVPGARGEVGVLSLRRRTFDEAAELVARLARETPDLSAVFCMNDAIALGVLHGLEQIGRRAPDDVSVIGFDDLPCASMMTPRLSTVRVDRGAMGAEAVALMEGRIANPSAPPRHVAFGVALVEGGTIGPPPGAP